jgi:hypothetical protein
MVNLGKVSLKTVMFNKPNEADRLGPKGTWPGGEAQRSSPADDAAPVERHNLTRSDRRRERGKPVVLSKGATPRDSPAQEVPRGRRAEEEGASEGPSVIGGIGVAP